MPTDISKKSSSKGTEYPFKVDSFIKDVCNDRYVLVIGSEVVLRKDGIYEPYNGDSTEYILHLLKERNEDLSEKKKAEIVCINDFMATLVEGESYLKELFAEDNRRIEDMSPELIAFLRTGIFKFVMTTTFDDYVEKLMRVIFQDDLRVVSFGDTESWSDLKNSIESLKDGERYDKPTLIYVFGKVSSPDDNRTSFVKTDDDAIRFIKKWLQETGAVVDYLEQKRIMALGCKFENWYFRFLWHILKRDFYNVNEGEVSISFNKSDDSDQRLQKYLFQKKIKTLPDARKFMSEVSSWFTPESMESLSPELIKAIQAKRALGGIFISYKSKNDTIAFQLYTQLKDLGYDVWIDCEKLCGGYYEEIIADAINKARAFIAVLTPNVANDFKDGSTNNYYNKEWKIAAQLNKDRIIPLAVNGYNLREPYHNTFKQIISLTDDRKIDGFNLMEVGDYAKLLRRINELLKIK